MKWILSPSISVRELPIRIQPRFAFAPVIAGRPVLREPLNGGELNTLRFVGYRLTIRPARGLDATPHVDELRVGDMNMERANRGRVAVRGFHEFADCRVRICEG
jgi:hypothetical protein